MIGARGATGITHDVRLVLRIKWASLEIIGSGPWQIGARQISATDKGEREFLDEPSANQCSAHRAFP
jgi:hypothetical protein